MTQQIQEKKSIVNVKPQPICRHVHVSKQTKSEGTPYLKGWCEKCKAWVYTEKRYCICCRRYVKHKNHFYRLKRILNNALDTHYQAIEDYKLFPHRSITYVEIEYDERIFHIPLKHIVLYADTTTPSEILPIIQDSMRIVKIK